jgi:Flp pilus assembly protein TadB
MKMPPGIDEITKKEIEKSGNKIFFWLDYVGAYIEDQTAKINKKRYRNKLILIAQCVSCFMAIFTIKTSLNALWYSLVATITVWFMISHFAWQFAMEKQEKLMRVFGEEVNRVNMEIQRRG